MSEQRQDLHLTECKRWPDRQDCGEECLEQIDKAPEDCQVRSMLVDWHKDKLCSLCSIEFEGVDTDEEGLALGYDNRPALITPDGKLIEWMSLSVGKLCEALRTHKPVCWRCLVAETLRRKHRGAGVGQD